MDTDLMAQRPKNQLSRIKHLHRGGRAGASSHENELIIKLPGWRVWLVLSRLALLAAAILTFPWARSVVRSPEPYYPRAAPSESIDDSFYLQMLLEDLSEVGLLRSGDRALFVGEAGRRCQQLVEEDENMDLISILLDDELHGSNALNETCDFAFADGFSTAELLSHALKTGGVMAVRMSGDPLASFWVPLNFKIVYIRQFDATVIAMRKTGSATEATLQSSSKRRLCGADLDVGKAKLISELEEAPLEPPTPRANSAESGAYVVDGTRYLPELTGDPLDGYPRRVFVEVGPAGGDGAGWFEQHYPKKEQVFDAYQVGTTKEGELAAGAGSWGISGWLAMNVREEEYVVMKADADAVEEMVKSRAICLVDELFMECNHHHQGQDGKDGGDRGRRRAYWECLALLGKLRGAGIAVHQWWA
ncbi:hypothetical protein ACLOJK_016444 [Asimina triloba]